MLYIQLKKINTILIKLTNQIDNIAENGLANKLDIIVHEYGNQKKE